VILKAGPNWNIAAVDETIWEHGRRNLELRSQGLLSVVGPILEGSEISGIRIFKVNIDEARDSKMRSV